MLAQELLTASSRGWLSLHPQAGRGSMQQARPPSPPPLPSAAGTTAPLRSCTSYPVIRGRAGPRSTALAAVSALPVRFAIHINSILSLGATADIVYID